jgi:hypothetical protein
MHFPYTTSVFANNISTGPRLGVRAGPNTGTFYTDLHATGLMAAGQPGAVRQLVEPGSSFGPGLPSADSECYSVEG